MEVLSTESVITLIWIRARIDHMDLVLITCT